MECNSVAPPSARMLYGIYESLTSHWTAQPLARLWRRRAKQKRTPVNNLSLPTPSRNPGCFRQRQQASRFKSNFVENNWNKKKQYNEVGRRWRLWVCEGCGDHDKTQTTNTSRWKIKCSEYTSAWKIKSKSRAHSAVRDECSVTKCGTVKVDRTYRCCSSIESFYSFNNW